MSGVDDPALAEVAAQAQGRAELTRVIETSVEAELSYRQGTRGKDVEETSHQLSRRVLAGSVLQDMWTSHTGVTYVWMTAPSQALNDALTANTQLSESEKNGIRERVLAYRDAQVEEALR